MKRVDTYESLLCWIAVWMLVAVVRGNHDAKRLYDDLLRKSKYNKLIRPVGNSSDTLVVKLGMKFGQLIDVDEKNEIITTNMWVIQEWEDVMLRWNPREYGGVKMLYVPSESIWLPDIVLYNNADGDYTVTLMTKATLNHFGRVTWEPPAIYKSQCDMNVKFFPFDEQICTLKFGSWTYDGTHVDLKHFYTDKFGLGDTDVVETGMDIKNYYLSVEWDVMSVPAKKTNKYYPCCDEPYPDITFNITIRRKALFYAINLIIPCISINMLTCLTFYLPSDSGEKISLCISVLLSLSVFQLMLMDLVPSTSITVPLLGKYILFTMILVSSSIFITIVTLNVNCRSSATHSMPELTKKIFLELMPRLLFMKKADDPESSNDEYSLDFPESSSDWNAPYMKKLDSVESDFENIYGNYSVSSTFIGAPRTFQGADLTNFCEACAKRKYRAIPAQAQKAMEGIQFVAKHVKDEDDNAKVKEDWRYLALVIDRFFFFVYVLIQVFAGLSIYLSPPVLYDNRVPITECQPSSPLCHTN